MFELPEFAILSRQMNETLVGKVVQNGSLGNSMHKFVWHNCTSEEFAHLTAGKMVGKTRSQGKWLFVPLEPGYVLLFGDCGGKLLFHPTGSHLPPKYHLHLAFTDQSLLTAMTQMWGIMDLYESGQELERHYVKNMRPTPVDPAFTFAYFDDLIDSLAAEKRSAKGLLTQDQLIPGLGNAIAQDILFHAHLHPKHPIADLDEAQRQAFYTAIQRTVQEVIEQGGRYDEVDLFGKAGGYRRLMDKDSAGTPCPLCGSTIAKSSYLGGACYFCPHCQR